MVLIIIARDRNALDVDAPKYPDMVARMKAALGQKFPLSAIEEFNYIPAQFEGDLTGVFGKVLVQYEPAHPDCQGKLRPTIRVWVQGNVVLDSTFHNYASQGQAARWRRNTSNTVCPLSWGQSVTPYEITAIYSASVTYTGPTTFLTSTIQYRPPSSSARSSQTTTLSTSVASSTVAGSSLFCFPSTGPGSVPTGLPPNEIAKDITDFCAAIDTSSQVLKGCDNQLHNGILLSVDCNGAGNAFGGPYATDGLPYKYPGITAWLNVTSIQGKSFIVNSSTCNSAFSAVLNDCPPLINDNILLPSNKFGGGVFILDGAGGGANFNILLIPTNTPGQSGVPGYAYVIASNLKSNALCTADYCNCGGTVAPLLTSTVSGSTTLNCAYSTQPTIATCPPPPTMTTSALPSIYPTGTTCDCNEDGCTPESPPRCANGSCPGQRSQPSHRVRALPTSTVCNCNENVCIPDSPPCCANGSCGT